MDSLYTSLIAADPAPPPTAAEVHPNVDLAGRLYPEPKAKPADVAPNKTIAALREGEPERAFYKDADQYGAAARELAAAVAPGVSSERLEGLASSWSSVAADLGLNRDDVSQLASWAAAYRASPPDEAQVHDNRHATMKALRETYGDDAGDALAAASALAKRDHRVAAFLDASGLGDHPTVVLRFAALAREERNARTLRK